MSDGVNETVMQNINEDSPAIHPFEKNEGGTFNLENLSISLLKKECKLSSLRANFSIRKGDEPLPFEVEGMGHEKSVTLEDGL